MKIKRVLANNKKKVVVIETAKGNFELPFWRLVVKPSKMDPMMHIVVDKELGSEGITYTLASGKTDSLHLDAFLDYNKDPDYLRQILLYKLTLKAQDIIKQKKVLKRTLSRRLKTSPTQLYRLLDQTFYGKTIDQMIRLLAALDCGVDVVFKKVA